MNPGLRPGLSSAAPPALNSRPASEGRLSNRPAPATRTSPLHTSPTMANVAKRLGLRQPSAAFSQPASIQSETPAHTPTPGQSGSFAPLRRRSPRRWRANSRSVVPAAERRQNVAHSVSCGFPAPQTSKPRQGRQTSAGGTAERSRRFRPGAVKATGAGGRARGPGHPVRPGCGSGVPAR